MGRRFPGFSGQGRRLWIGLSMALVSLMILVACGGTATGSTSAPVAQTTPTSTPTPVPATQSANVVIVQMLESPPGHYFFKPDTLTITAGTTVVWIDNSDAAHTVTSDTSAFNTTNNVTEGKTFGLVFNTPGTYHYHCNIHPNMKAVITVTS